MTVVGIVKYLHALPEKSAAAIFKHNLLMINTALKRNERFDLLRCGVGASDANDPNLVHNDSKMIDFIGALFLLLFSASPIQ